MGNTSLALATRSGSRAAGVDDLVLESKITVPAVPEWAVARPRVEGLVAQGAMGPLTAVTGPPGAGKTMALSLWAAREAHPGPIAWVTVDQHDNRPRVFWSYVIAALRRAGVIVPKNLSLTRGCPVNHEFLLRLAAVIAGQDPPVVLVLDDIHLLTEPKVLSGLDYVLRNGVPGLHLVVSSRMDPLLPLHRYRLAGELTEVRADDLAFSVSESKQLMAQHGIRLSPESLESLTQRAEGWAAGVRLAAMSMTGHADPEQFVKDLVAEDSTVAGYLVEEVLNAQPAHVRDFMLKTSILDRVSAEIADVLAGEGQGASVLPSLARSNAFVQREGRGWYRYHSLFAAVLRLKLRRENPERVPDLHRRAAWWYRRNGSLVDAVRHAAQADDWQLAARMALDELAVGQLIEPRGHESLADGFRSMPRDLEWTEPQPLLVAAAIELSRGQDGLSGALAAAAESILERLPGAEEIPSRLAAALIGLALARRSGDLGAATAASDTAQRLLATLPEDLLAARPMIRGQVLAGWGAVEFWSGHFEEAVIVLNAAVALARRESIYERSGCLGYLALLEALQGRLGRATELAAGAAGEPGRYPDRSADPVSPAEELALAWVNLERNELSLARNWLKRAHDSVRSRPDRLISAIAGLAGARLALAEGRAKAVPEIVSRARQGWSPPPWLEHRLMLTESRAFVAMSDYTSAADAATRADPASSLDATIALAQARLAAGDPHAARQALAGAPDSDGPQDPVRLARCLVDAQLSYHNGDHARGRQALEQALRLGEADQLRLPFAMERSWIRPVLRRDPELARAHHRLLEPGLVSAGRPHNYDPSAAEEVPLIVDQLSEREREVLRHVAAMLSTAEIAAEMFISVNTVKTHLKSIYRKLAAAHRGEAVRRARQLNLL